MRQRGKPAALALRAAQRSAEAWRVAGTPFVDGYLAALLARASSLISAEFHQVVRRERLPVPEWRILASLSGNEPTPVGRLAQLALAPQPTVTRQLDRMQAKGLVQRVAHDRDRRVTLAALTPKGERLAGRLIALARAHERRVLAPFGRERAALLKTILREMIEQHQQAVR
jgi:DNA-binding MarR family transcriptional regulator